MTKFYAWLKNLFVRHPKKIQTKSSIKVEAEEVGFQHTTIKHLLADLDITFKHLKKMSPRKRSAQQLVRKFGPFIMGDGDADDMISAQELEGFKAYGFPSVLIGYWPKRERIRTSEAEKDWEDDCEYFVCAHRCHSLNYIGKRQGCIYYEVSYVVMLDRKKRPWECEFYIEANKTTGEVKALKIPQIERAWIPAKKRRKGEPEGCTVSRQVWKFPKIPTYQMNQLHTANEFQSHLEETFVISYNAIMRREYGINIIVKKGQRRATFTVPQNRWKYFFRERLDVKTLSGRKRPIFHAVMAHKRHYKSGKTSFVKTHYKGSRHFVWNGFEIIIVMQGKHGVSQADFNLSSFDETDTDRKLISLEDDSVIQSINTTFEGAYN